LKAYIKCIKNNICCEENNNISETEGKEGESKSIIDEFIEDKNILKNKEKLIAFMEELKFILKTGNNCIIPFLDLCPILIKSYIESDLDEEGGDSKLKYVEIFELLKYNSFISREYLCPIYDYFGRLHYLINTLKEDDKRLKKFKKVLELWNIIYTFESNNYPEMEIYNKIDKKMDKISCQTNTSSFCLLGTGLEFTFNEDIIPFEKCAWQKAMVMPQLPDTCMTVQFSHIMAGGYSAGYYSYKWAEVLDADAFAVFKKEGIFNPATAQRFRDCILSKGGTENPMTLYKRFKGSEPTIDALLKRNGISRKKSKS
jgi:hypothetical protein